jgi:hypothetical protein
MKYIFRSAKERNCLFGLFQSFFNNFSFKRRISILANGKGQQSTGFLCSVQKSRFEKYGAIMDE